MGDYVREVEVEFMYKDSPEVYTEEVTLMRGDSRQMFFFQGWKVMDNMPFLARNFQVEVPTGATLVVDGLVADESLCQEHRQSTDLYSLDLFVGTHDINVVTPLGSQSQSYSVWSDDDYLYAGDAVSYTHLDVYKRQGGDRHLGQRPHRLGPGGPVRRLLLFQIEEARSGTPEPIQISKSARRGF